MEDTMDCYAFSKKITETSHQVDSQLEEKKREKKRKGKERKGRKKHPTPHTQRLRSNSVKKLRLKLMDQTKKESIRYRNQSTKISADVMRYY
jgi:hypothetical protein